MIGLSDALSMTCQPQELRAESFSPTMYFSSFWNSCSWISIYTAFIQSNCISTLGSLGEVTTESMLPKLPSSPPPPTLALMDLPNDAPIENPFLQPTTRLSPRKKSPKPRSPGVFSYSPLDDPARDIRLLVLHPGNSNDPLEGHIETTTFGGTSPVREYQALSYTWGSPESPHAMKLDEKDFRIRTNLHWALRRLRDRLLPLVLWIDAICINQDDTEERDQQVQQMTNVYSQATHVKVWLGQSTRETRKAMTFLRHIEASGETSTYLKSSLRNESNWSSLLILCGLDYWTRVWIVQEVGLAKDLQIFCGVDQIAWQVLDCVLDWLEVKALKSENDGGLSNVVMAVKSSIPAKLRKQRLARQSGICELATILRDSENSLCHDPRDKIYGFLGLATDYDPKELPIVYSKPLLQLHGDVCRFYAKKISCLNTVPESSGDYSPSILEFGYLISRLLGIHRPQSNPTAHSPLQWSIPTNRDMLSKPPNRDMLFCQGPVPGLCTITHLTRQTADPNFRWLESVYTSDDYLEIGSFRPPWDRNERQWRRELNVEAQEYKHECFNTQGSVGTVLSLLDSESCANESLSTIGRTIPDSESVPFMTTEYLQRRFRDPVERNGFRSDEGKIFWSRDGFLGYVSPRAQVGDWIYSFPGLDLALVVRPNQDLKEIVGTALIRPSTMMWNMRTTIATKLLERRSPPPPMIFHFDWQTFQILTCE